MPCSPTLAGRLARVDGVVLAVAAVGERADVAEAAADSAPAAAVILVEAAPRGGGNDV